MDYLLSLALSPSAWVALAALIAMEVVLGIDNLIFISILTNKLRPEHQTRARRVGIGLALGLRLLLLGSIAWVVQLTDPLVEIFDQAFSWRDLIMIGGGLFLVWKSTTEIHENVQPTEAATGSAAAAATLGFGAALVQIIMLDLVFSLDSIITAVGMTEHLPIMVVAVVVAVMMMFVAADPLARFIHHNPTVVMLALGFLLMVGMTLIAEGFGVHVPKGYIYAAMAFSALVEGLNMLSRKARARASETRETETPEPEPRET
jgi:predicted tellurium resistance membrane protein TerC